MEQIEDILIKELNAVEDGQSSYILLKGKVKNLKAFLKDYEDQIEEGFINEFDRETEDGKRANLKGFTVEKRSGGWLYDFKGVEAFKTAENKVKELKEHYKQLFLHADCVDPETGEVLDITRKPKADSYIITKIKE